MSGSTHAEAASAAAVARSTVTKWCNHDTAFGSELRDRQQSRAAQLDERLACLLDRAVSVVAGHLAQDDLRAAIAVLRLLLRGGTSAIPRQPNEDETNIGEQLRARVERLLQFESSGERRPT